jgi:aspartate/methionine/tyrosine aminotransferase
VEREKGNQMHIKPFGIEMWMNEFEDHCKYNLAETCVKSMTIGELLEISGKNIKFTEELSSMKLTYGEITGSKQLRKNIASLYKNQTTENVMVTHGAIGANSLIYNTLISKGDKVVSVLPTYQQHYSIPESLGAELSILKLKPEHKFLPDINELKQLIKPDTKLIALTNPNNPTGSLMDEALLLEIVDIARTCDAYIICDEVYRGTNQNDPEYGTSIVDIYEKGISTGSMSKTYSLAGLRLGWITASPDILKDVFIHRDYNTISVGVIDDYFASIALENRKKIALRNTTITRNNLEILDNWVKNERFFSYVKPKAGTTALLKYEFNIPSREFCIQILKNTGVLFAPGSAMDMEGWVRIGYANDSKILTQGLTVLSKYLDKL